MAHATLEFWFDFGSTYSHVSAQRAPELCAQAGVALRWQPFLLGPIFKAQGWNDSPFNLYPVKGRYMWRDMHRQCEKYGIPLRKPSAFPRNGLLPARVALAAAGESWLTAFIQSVFLANFGDDLEINEPTCVARLLRSVGCSDPDSWLGRAASDAVKQRLREQTDAAVARGIFGAPTFALGDELFWGDDRLEDALAFATRR